MTLTTYKDHQELFANCNGYWDLRNNTLPITGTVSGTITGSVVTPDRFGVANRAYLFDGTDDKITMGNTAVSIKSLLVWVKLSSTTQSILKLTDTPHTITVSSGTLTASGWPATVVLYVNGASGSTVDTNWALIGITTSGDAFAASNLILGYDGSSYLNGLIGEILTFSTQLSAVEMKTFYNLMSKYTLYPLIASPRGQE
ncbi:MAG: hypothetical protein PHS80_00090 [Methanothrix sp.]|nr:hypothetical protein [Methanothrix sp.]